VVASDFQYCVCEEMWVVLILALRQKRKFCVFDGERGGENEWFEWGKVSCD
jgi:hypothetical protein